MSATLLWCVLFLGTLAPPAYTKPHGRDMMIPLIQNKTFTLTQDETTIYSKNQRIVVEEVDKNGNSVVKELELPDYDDTVELQDDKRRREQQEKIYQTEALINFQDSDMYGCNNKRGNQKRKCLQRQKKLLRKRYKNWKELIRRIIKDLDGKIKTLGINSRKESKTENLNFMSGFSPRNAMRKKE